MQKNQKKKGVHINVLQGTTNCTAGAKKNHSTQLTASQLQILPFLRWGGTAFSSTNRAPPFLLRPAGAALQLAQIEAQLALHQINAIATATAVACNQTHLTPSPFTLLNLLQQAAATSTVTATTGTPPPLPYQNSQPLQTGMYRPQTPRAPYSRGRPETGHGGRSQGMGYQMGQFPPPTQLPEELESALAIRGPRDEDSQAGHMPHLNPAMRNNQGSGKGQRPDFSPSPVPLTSDNQPGHQRGMDWSQYQPPSKLFGPPRQGQSHSNLPGSTAQAWSASSASDSPSQLRGGDFQGLHTPESAGTILASFGLSNEDLELLSHYPDDQLTPDTLPFILREIQRNKASGRGGRNIQSKTLQFNSKMPPPLSHGRSSPQRYAIRGGSPELPSMLTVTQTAGKVIDYGHASRALEEGFKREPLSKDVIGLSGPKNSGSSSSSPLSKLKSESPSKRHHSRDSTPSSSDAKKYSNEDYRRRGQPKVDGFQPEWTVRDLSLPASAPVKSRPEDFNHPLHSHSEGSKLRPLSESRSESSSTAASLKGSGRPPLVSKRQRSRRRPGAPTQLPSPTVISDFRAESPKVYPHTCSLCLEQCEQAKDWLKHINTVNHTASCRDLRNQYPDWRPDVPRHQSRTSSSPVKDGGHRGRPKGRSPSRSISWSPSPSPPSGRGRRSPHPFSERPHHRRSYSPLPYRARSGRGSSSSSSCQRPEKRTSESSGISTSSLSQSRLKRSRGNPVKNRPVSDRSPSSIASSSKACPGDQVKVTRKSPSSLSDKTPGKPGTKLVSKAVFKRIKPWKMAQTSPKNQVDLPPPAKKRKKKNAATSQQRVTAVSPSRLVYLSGLPADASKEEVSQLVKSYGEICNIAVRPCPAKGEAQEASAKAVVYMAKTEDAQSLVQCFSLSIRDRTVSVSASKKLNQEQTIPVIIKGQVVSFPKTAAVSATSTSSAKKKGKKTVLEIPNKMGVVLIEGLPEGGYSEGDISKLAQPFGTPSEIFIATRLGKALVILPDEDIAEEMVKVHTFVPVKINESELKMGSMKHSVNLSTPVELYNIFRGPADVVAPVTWNTLLVVRNVPDTLTGPEEVQKLVKRFGAFKEALVLNHNMIIFEMITSAVALDVYKRFRKYPCIIQNNPLTFSHRPDPMRSEVLQSTVPDAALPGGQEASLLNGEGKEKKKGKTVSKPAGVKEKSPVTQKDLPGCEVMEKVKTEEIEVILADHDPASKPESNETSTALETAKSEHTPLVNQPAATATPGQKDQPASQVTLNNPQLTSEPPKVTPELPKVTPEILKALLEECRARSSSRANKPPASPLSKEGNKVLEETDGKDKEGGAAKMRACEDGFKKERERRLLGKRKLQEEEKMRRLEEKEEREEKRRREEERRRTHRDGSSGSRSSGRSEVSRRSSKSSTKRDALKTLAHKDQKEHEETKEEEEDFMAFNMEDFVTVDEVGDAMEVGIDHTQTTVPDMPTPGIETAPADTHVAGSNTTAPPQSAPDATASPSLVTTTVAAATPSEATPVLETAPQLASEEALLPVPILDITSLIANVPDTIPFPEAIPTPVQEATPTSVLETTPPNIPETTPMADVKFSPTPILDPMSTHLGKEERDGKTVSKPAEVKEESPVTQKDLPGCEVMEKVKTEEIEEILADHDPASKPESNETSTALETAKSEHTPLVNQPAATATPGQKDQPASQVTLNNPQLTAKPPKVTPEILKALLEECRARSMPRILSTPVMAKQKLLLPDQRPTLEKEQRSEEEQVETPKKGQESQEGEEEEQDKLSAGRDSNGGKPREERKEEEEEDSTEQKHKTEPLFPKDYTLPPFNPSCPVGLEFLEQKVGFFCKMCRRFYTGTQEAEKAHCRTINHYQNLQKSLQQWRAKENMSGPS